MKEKILTALKTEYASFGLSKEVLDRVASIIVKTVTKEEEIDGAIKDASIKDFVSLMQKESDKLRQEKSAAEKALTDYKASHPDAKPDDKDKDKDKPQTDPAIAALQAEVAELKRLGAEKDKENAKRAVRDALDKKLREGGCVNDYVRANVLKGVEIKDNDTADSLFETTKTSYNAEMKLAFGDSYVPQVPNPNGGAYKVGEFASFKKQMQAEGNLPAETK